MNSLTIGAATIHQGDCLASLQEMADQSVQMCVTSPPYFGLRDYGHDGQLGLEPTPEEYVAAMVAVFREVRRVLADDGTLWLNIGDSYASTGGHGSIGATSQRAGRSNVDVQNSRKGYAGGDGIKAKDLIGIPWMLAFALRADGWYLRQDIIWHKPNPMPESVRDRCTKAHEYIFLLSKSERYFYDHEAVKEPAKDWTSGGPGIGIKETHHYGAGNGGNAGLKGLAARYKRDSFKREDSKRNEAIPGQAAGTHRPDREDSTYDLTKRNRRSVWTVATRPYKGAHFATFPPALIEPCILAGSRPGDVVIDPFNGSGTTGQVSLEHGRRYVGCELNPEYVELTRARLEPIVLALSAALEPDPQSDLFAMQS